MSASDWLRAQARDQRSDPFTDPFTEQRPHQEPKQQTAADVLAAFKVELREMGRQHAHDVEQERAQRYAVEEAHREAEGAAQRPPKGSSIDKGSRGPSFDVMPSANEWLKGIVADEILCRRMRRLGLAS